MINDNEIILAFDTKDTDKNITLISDKKRKVLAITPNAYELLSENGFKDIVSPYDLNKNLHTQLAEDNMKFRDKLNSINQNSTFSKLCDENFKNIFIQIYSSINFFLNL